MRLSYKEIDIPEKIFMLLLWKLCNGEVCLPNPPRHCVPGISSC